MMKAYRHLYTEEDGYMYPNLDASEDFEKHLTTTHKAFFDSLSHEEQQIVHGSLDPFDVLRLLWITKGKPERQTRDSQPSHNTPPPDEL